MSPRWDVIGIGENSIDYVYRLPEYPKPRGFGAKMPIAGQMLSPGGQIATALCTCAAMGLRTKYVGSFGGDDNGVRMRRELVARGVDTSDSFTRDATNRYAVILVDEQKGERVVLWHRDPALAIQAKELRCDVVSNTRVLHVDDVDEATSIAAARMARAAGALVTSDIDRCTEATEELMMAVTVPIFSEQVPEALTGESDPERALRKLRGRGDALLCVTLGSRGAMLLEGDRLHMAPGHVIDTVDTTGAGDVFRGAFIAAMLRGDPPRDVLRFSNAAAALSCMRRGAINSVPTLAEVEYFLDNESHLDDEGRPDD